MPMGDKLKELLKKEVGIFSRDVMFLKNTPTSHAVSLALFMYTFSSAMLPLPCTCLYNNSKRCLSGEDSVLMTEFHE